MIQSKMIQTIGLVGYGVFGKLLAHKLKDFFEIKIYDKKGISLEGEQNLQRSDLVDVLNQKVIIIAIPVQFQEQFWVENASKVRLDSLIMDVSSVKIEPINLMQKYLPESVQIIGLHPLFGPHSVASQGSWDGFTVVSCPVRVHSRSYRLVKNFIQKKLKLRILETSPEEHDKEMAFVQALTFFIGKSVEKMNIPQSPLSTRTYNYLLSIKSVVESDTNDLFETIQKHNPFAKQVREDFLESLNKINQDLELGTISKN